MRGYGDRCSFNYKDHSLVQRACGFLNKSFIWKIRQNCTFTTMLAIITVVLALIIRSDVNYLSEKINRIVKDRVRHSSGHREAGRDETAAMQAWIRADYQETGYLKHVTGVLKSIGYSTDGGTYSNWNLLWSHDYPFEDKALKVLLMNLKPNQKVNKVAGSGYVTSKVFLATSVLKNVPKAFKIPAEADALRAYAKAHPETLWVQKSNSHRGIKITPVGNLDLSNSGTFVQQYVDKPMIIDKRKFDIGVYTIVTSVDPLRIYIVNHEMLLRFCAHDYYPFDDQDRAKYVVTDDYTPVWEIPSLNKYYRQGFTAKQSFYQYMKDIGFNADKIYSDIETTIGDVYLSKISNIRDAMQSYNNRNFFEMVRFDYVIDELGNVYLMEVNMSPNLSSQHFFANRLLYEQVVYNLFNLVGLVNVVERRKSLSLEENEMIVSPKDLSADPAICLKCSSNCLESVLCKTCYSCMSSVERTMFEDSYKEHSNKKNTKRVFPPPMVQSELGVKPEYWDKLSDTDKLMHTWFEGKCRNDISWC